MNVVFLLVPKRDVIYLPLNSSLRQAFETLRAHNWQAVPVLDRHGHYRGTVSNSDLLNFIYDQAMPDLQALEKYPISLILDHDTNPPLRVDLQLDELLDRLQEENFVAISDDRDYFVGIITRKSVISYLRQRFQEPVRKYI